MSKLMIHPEPTVVAVRSRSRTSEVAPMNPLTSLAVAWILLAGVSGWGAFAAGIHFSGYSAAKPGSVVHFTLLPCDATPTALGRPLRNRISSTELNARVISLEQRSRQSWR